MKHIFTIDAEEWFDGIDGGIRYAHREKRLRYQMDNLLHLLRLHGVHATFFWLGSAAKDYPDLVKQTSEEGHEVGCHGLTHSPIYNSNPDQFRTETYEALSLLSELTGKPVKSYRAPYFSLTKNSLWALGILAELGIKYDSSIFPIRHWKYGIEDFPAKMQILHTPSGDIVEAPLPVRLFCNYRLPSTGGAYFRLYPYSFTHNNILKQQQNNQSVVFYLHPWEIDDEQPRINSNWKVRLPHYYSLNSTVPKLHRLLSDFSFSSLETIASKFVEDSCKTISEFSSLIYSPVLQ